MRRLVRFASSLSLLVAAGCSNDSTAPHALSDASVHDAAVVQDATPTAIPDAKPLPDVSAPPLFDAAPPRETSVDAAPGADDASDASDASVAPTDYPRLLSQTGLFSDMAKETLADGVRNFEPRYVLWSDGATKRRWLYLPPGAQIDTTDMDFWTYPVGTTAWKEFTSGKIRVETRMLRKNGPKQSDWTMIAYQWKSDQSDAVAVPLGKVNASGTTHDIPSQHDCQFCHGNMKDTLLGVSAIQLSHGATQPGFRIDDLIAEGRLSSPPAAAIQIPGGPVAEAALGYLHANCGVCHNSQSGIARATALRLWESTTQLDTVEHTLGYETTVLRPNGFYSELHVIEPGRPDLSELVLRISQRGAAQMPPIATKIVDPMGIATVRTWVESLPRPTDAGAPDAH
ncbi:MAG TPA: hypothetical protein VH062_27225 [Polyangiaceae bacterium]|jgi:hypothetical protein|nr:hypothetical protein [Polyangiaceae bacterium]